jgi:hypothetical protein
MVDIAFSPIVIVKPLAAAGLDGDPVINRLGTNRLMTGRRNFPAAVAAGKSGRD